MLYHITMVKTYQISQFTLLYLPCDAYSVDLIYVGVFTPTNVRSTMVTSRSIQITWEPSSSSDVTGYLISYSTTALYTSGGSVTVDGGSTRNHNLTNLEEDTLYNISVKAINIDNDLSVYSNEVPRTYTDGA